MGEKKRVVLDKKKLGKRFVDIAEREIEVPEMNALMGLDDGDIAIVKIRQLHLNEYLNCQMSMEDQMRNLVEGVIAAAEKRGEVEAEMDAALKGLSPQSEYQINLCSVGVIEPKMTRRDWIFLASHYPMMIERIATSILLLTQGGATLKKNS